ncbi:uncharacterized protein C8R40DRAFT_406357 [Lentinula edodes]|uniref:uncharacterized protein n=1 Tax=Lentinula edodes TaxID=5353 RepID=UPI001E8CB8C8|nr:uncharacterized protein C8R40DRAFT_406357 [Lentinula edodes]KAH7872936.1 hypothetical protein C8R40DRAFT_406357 [Lentinula edodes]
MLPSLNSFSFLLWLSLTAIGVFAGPTRKGGSSKFNASGFDSSKLLGYAYYSSKMGMVGNKPQIDIFPSYGTVPQYAENCQKCLVFDDNGWVKKKTLVDDETYETQHTRVLIILNALWHEASLRIECPQRGEPGSLYTGYDYDEPVDWKRLGIL